MTFDEFPNNTRTRVCPVADYSLAIYGTLVLAKITNL